jgi:putative membrane protein
VRIVALVLVGIAVLIHVYIFVLESLTWTTPRTRAVFGTDAESAAATRELAFNQGFYNLFLAIGAAVGIVLTLTGATAVGAALIFACAGSMVLAGLVLLTSSPGKARAALVQLVAPLLGIAALALCLS